MQIREKSVDVIVQSYGKGWQLLCTLKSLMKYSSTWIDKIYFIEEKEQPYSDNISWVKDHFNNIIYHIPPKWVYIYGTKSKDVPENCIRHQFGIENSDKKYVFICHNDVLFTGDIIGNMLNQIEDCVGIGEIGQCWNCPAKLIGKCSGEKFYDWNPDWEEVKKLPIPHIRTRWDNLDRDVPKLLPECRLNEFACLINREICIKEGRPYFGEFDEDSGTEWFKSMYKKGYKFKDYRKDFIHGFYAKDSGFQNQQNKEKYFVAEDFAKQYYEENLKHND